MQLDTSGVNLKAFQHKQLSCLIRVGTTVTGEPETTNILIRSEIIGTHRIFNLNLSELYTGIGVRNTFTIISSFLPENKRPNSLNYYTIKIPLGIQLFTSENKKLSITVESGIEINLLNNTEYTAGYSGLLEITYYIFKNRKDLKTE